jgi:TonB family protein
MPRITLFLAAVLLAATALAQQSTPIQGVIRDDKGNLVAGARVRLVLRNDLIAETQSDSIGTFRFDAPASTGYSVHVVKPGLCIGSVAPENMGHDPINVILHTPEGPVPSLIQVSSIKQQARVLRAVAPDYPEQALAAGLGGTVTVDILIDELGTPASVTSSSDRDPLLVNAALAAAGQWRYRATALNCVPVQVESQIHFDFSAAAGKVRL